MVWKDKNKILIETIRIMKCIGGRQNEFGIPTS